MTLDPEKKLTFSPLHRLQWEEAQQRHVILYPEGLVELNATAAEILQLCDGTRTFSAIVDELERKFETSGLADDIREMLEASLANGWIRQF
jgi:pyrroloquinoline quinone biosynthesis protein D